MKLSTINAKFVQKLWVTLGKLYWKHILTVYKFAQQWHCSQTMKLCSQISKLSAPKLLNWRIRELEFSLNWPIRKLLRDFSATSLRNLCSQNNISDLSTLNARTPAYLVWSNAGSTCTHLLTELWYLSSIHSEISAELAALSWMKHSTDSWQHSAGWSTLLTTHPEHLTLALPVLGPLVAVGLLQ